jgi:hypothetical protein
METKNEFQLLEEFVQSKPNLSFSGLSKYLYSPYLYYKHYVLNQKEDVSGDFITKGKLLHCLVLEPENFAKKFVLLPNKLPIDNHQVVLKMLYSRHLDDSELLSTPLSNYQDEIGQIMSEIDYYSAIKTDSDRGKKLILDINEEYWNYLLTADSKVAVSTQDYNEILEKTQLLKQDRVCNYLLDFDESEKEVFIPGVTEFFGLKGVIDCIKFKHSAKTVFVSDLKTTSKRIQDFPETVEYYSLWLQAALYYKFAKQYYPDYEVVFTFIVVDSYGVVYPFKVTDDTMKSWLIRTDIAIEQIKESFEKKNFSLPNSYLSYGVSL